MSKVGTAIFDTINYVNPFSEGFKKDFRATKDWNCFGRVVTIALGILFGCAAVIPGVLFFRWTVSIVNGCSKKKNDIENPKDNEEIHEEEPISEEEPIDEEVHEEEINKNKKNEGVDENPKEIKVEDNKPKEIKRPFKDPVINRKIQPLNSKEHNLSNEKTSQILSVLKLKTSWGAWAAKKIKTGAKWVGEKTGIAKESTNRKEVEWKTRRYEGMVVEWKARILACDEQVRKRAPLSQVLEVLKNCEMSFADEKRFEPEHIVNHRENVKSILLGCILFIRQQYEIYKMPSDYRNDLDLLSYLFFESDLSPEMDYTLKVFNDINKQPEFNDPIQDEELFGKGDFLTGMEQFRNKIETAPQSYKGPSANQNMKNANGNTGIAFDPILDGNLPHKLYQFNLKSEEGDSQRVVDVHALPTPTNEEVVNKGSYFWPKLERDHKIDPEFKGALRHGVKNGKKYLYVINQNLLSNGTIKNEQARCKLLLDLQEDFALKGSFFCIALSKDSEFYLNGGFKTNKESFKKELYDQIFGNNIDQTGSVIPQEIKNKFDNFGKSLNEIIDSVLNCYKNNDLTLNERKAIIEQTYDLLTLALVDKLEANKLIVACKDTADRTGAANGRLYGHISLVENGRFLEPEKNKIAQVTQVRAPFAKKRAIEKGRFDRMINTLKETSKCIQGFTEAFGKAIGNKKIEILKLQPVIVN